MRKNRFIVRAGISGMVLSMLCGAAFAETTISRIDVAEGVVTVKGTTDAEEAITYEVYDKGVTTPVLSDIVGFGEVYHYGSGEYSLDFGLKNGGSFKVRISDEDGKAIGEFDYADSEDRAAFVSDVAKMLKTPDTAAEEIEKALTDEDNRAVLNTIGIGFETYADYSDNIKEEICEKMVELGKNTTLDESSLLKLYKDAEMLARLNNDGDASSEEILDKLNPVFEETAHNEIESSAKKVWIEKAVAENVPYDTIEEIEDIYGKVSALYIINNAKVTNIENKVTGYASLLEITDESEYKTYKSKVSSAVNKKLVAELDDTEAYTVDDLLDALKSAASGSSAGSGGAPSGGSSSGGGGSSSGGGHSTITGGSSSVTGGYVIEGSVESDSGVQTEEKTGIFADVDSSHWAYEAVSELQARGIINGYGDGTFLPDRTVTREEFVKMIVAAFGMEDENASSSFIDVFSSDWFYPYVSAAFEKGIVKGDHLGLFGIHTDITRQDATVMAARAMRAAEITAEAVREYTGFNDEAFIADYATEDVKTLYRAGKINGTDTNNFEPQRSCTRAEAAAIIYGISR